MASDASARDGIGWEFADMRQNEVWYVFREDGGDFPVFSARRVGESLPSIDDLEAMTFEAVADLLAAAGLPDHVGWMTRNISSALLLASLDVRSWEGEEWALAGPDEEPLIWAGAGSARIPFVWIRARGTRDALIGIYQDDANFGLSFIPPANVEAPTLGSARGSLRPRRGIPIVTGRINAVEIVYDTLVDGGDEPGLLTEALLHGDAGSTLLIAAEAYGPDEWHLYDESVVVIRNPDAADALDWIPPRRGWTPQLGAFRSSGG